MITVIHIKNAPKGWEDNFDYVYIGRKRKGKDEYGYFGNPFFLKSESDRKKVIEQYKEYFYDRIERDDLFKVQIDNLKNKTLVCYCSPLPCHGDVIAEWLNKQ